MSKREHRQKARANRRKLFLEAWKRSQAQGASLSAFCRDYGLCRKSFYSWLKASGQVARASCIRRTDPVLRKKALEIFARYRGTWTAETISLALDGKLSAGSIRSICRPFRGLWERAETRSVRKSGRLLKAPEMPNLIWSTDWTEWRIHGKKFFILVVLDEAARLFLGWSVLSRRPNARAVCALVSDVLARYSGRPLLLKSDRARVFQSIEWEDLLERAAILPHRINPRSPWEQGIVERAIRELKGWLRAHDINDEGTLLGCVNEGMLMLNFLKPKAVLAGRTPAATYWAGTKTPRQPLTGTLAQARPWAG